jgi:hypothetical protein
MMWQYGVDVPGLEQGPVAGRSEGVNEPWGSVKAREFLD